MRPRRSPAPSRSPTSIAQALNISGTPTYIIGDELIPGAIGLDELRERIANMRECGSTYCEGSAGPRRLNWPRPKDFADFCLFVHFV